MVAVLNTGGRREAAKFIAATVVAALDGSATRYAVIEFDGGMQMYGTGPFASATSATKFADRPQLRKGNSMHVVPLTPAPKANRPRYLK